MSTARIIPVGYAEITFFGAGTGFARGWQVTLGVKPTSVDPTVVATACGLAWTTRIMPQLSNMTSIISTRAKLGPNETGFSSLVTTAAVGGSVGEAESPQVALNVRKVTGTGGRKGRGRMFVPGVAEGATPGGGSLSPAAVTLIQGAFNNFRADLVAANCPPYLLHAAILDIPTLITSFSVDPLLATQRRRLRKVGGRRLSV